MRLENKRGEEFDDIAAESLCQHYPCSMRLSECRECLILLLLTVHSLYLAGKQEVDTANPLVSWCCVRRETRILVVHRIEILQ